MTLARPTGSTGVLTAQGVIFHHRLSGAIAREPLEDGRFRRVNREATRSTGLELLAELSASSGVSLTGDLLLQRVRVHDPTVSAAARHAEHQPESRARVGIDVPLPLMARLLADLRYVGRQFCILPELAREAVLEGRAEADLLLERSWALDQGRGGVRSLRATVGVQNVTDASVYDQCGLPRPGRTLSAGLSLFW